MQSEDQAFPHRFRWLMVALTVLAACGTPTPALHTPGPRPDIMSALVSAVAYHQFAVWADTIHQAELDQFFAGVGLARFVESLPAPVAPVPSSQPSSHGGHSDAWFAALSQCESGGVNGWRTGLYGIEAGYPIGDMSPGEQLAWARRIDAESGDSAWACSPTASAAVPGG